MKAEIDYTGKLHLIAENKTDLFALKSYVEKHVLIRESDIVIERESLTILPGFSDNFSDTEPPCLLDIMEEEGE
jgi:hypothetical protein